MTEQRQRRLDGLATPSRSTSIPPPSPAAPGHQTEPDPPREPATPSPTTRTRTTKPTTTTISVTASAKHRRAVSVPAPLAQQLRERAQELDRFHTDLVLECLAALAPAINRNSATNVADTEEPLVRPPRRAHRGRTVTTLTLYLSQGEVEAIDELAHTTGRTRSGLVAEALERHLAGIS